MSRINKNLKIFFLLIFILLIVSIPVMGELQVHYIDVGQGDSILIQTEKNKNMLIDAGNRFSSVSQKMISYLQQQDVEKVDVIVCTHPHSDHVGGIPAIINNFEVGKIYDSGRVHTSATYENYLLLIDEKDIPFSTPRAGETISLGDLEFKVLYPNEENVESYSLNNSSIVLHLEYKNVSFLFTGDIETEVEKKILESGFNIKSNILKVAHHGSSSSSHDKFINIVKPKIAIIQVGENNKYGHPSVEVVNFFKNRGIDVYRNDIHGDIIINTDGTNYSVETSKDMDNKAPPVIIEENKSDKININTASASELQKLSGIGSAISKRIIEYREKVSLFKAIEDIMNVSGIGEGTFNNIKNEITVFNGKGKIIEESSLNKLNINTANKSQIQQLWGIGEVIAERIVEYRNENGLFKTIEEIKEVDGVDEYKFDKWKHEITI